MVRLAEMADVLGLIRDRRLELRDAAPLLALIAHIDWKTGRSKTTAAAVAAELGIRSDNCRASMSRLRRQALAVWVVNRKTGESYYLVNPALAFSGSAQQRGLAWQQFREALEADLPGARE